MTKKSAFAEAFDIARNQGVSEFNFNGKKYNTRKKGESVSQWQDYVNSFKKPSTEITYTAGALNKHAVLSQIAFSSDIRTSLCYEL